MDKIDREENRYGDLLLRPQWWAMRILVADKAQYRCEECGKHLPIVNYKPTGEAHHTKYTASKPWLEPIENMQYLCHDCHEEKHDRQFGFAIRANRTQSVGAVVNKIIRTT